MTAGSLAIFIHAWLWAVILAVVAIVGVMGLGSVMNRE